MLWEYLTFTKLSTGGYELTVPLNDDKLSKVEYAPDSGGPYIRLSTESTQVIGLHLCNPNPFKNFRWVIPGSLARSSAPHYVSDDNDENMDEEAVGYLVKQNITSIISFTAAPCLKQRPTDLIIRE